MQHWPLQPHYQNNKFPYLHMLETETVSGFSSIKRSVSPVLWYGLGSVRDGEGVDLGQASLKVSLLSFALGVSGLKDTGSRHEVLNVLTQDLVLRLQLQVLFLYSIDSGRQVL